MGRLRKSKKKFEHHDFDLQITSLADILIILLVFLLKSYSTDANNEVEIPGGITIPTITKANRADEGYEIHISTSDVKVEGKRVATLIDGRFRRSDLNGDLTNNGTSKALIRGLRDAPKDKGVWIIADQKVPYRTIQTVLASAALNGLGEFKLAVVKEE